MTPQRLEGPADWVIEIASESDPGLDYREELPRYRQAGIEEIWLINFFENEVLVETKTAAGYASKRLQSGSVESTVVPGFRLEVSWLWQEELPPTLQCVREMLG
jgi:Uma2 family endonuclease